MDSPVDVSQLAVRSAEPPRQEIAVRRHLVSRYFLPAAIAAALLALMVWAARDVLLPSQEVTVMPVIARRSALRSAGAPLFTAAGWVEARPTPVLVTALAEGVIQRLLVVEDQAVEAGEPIAHLIPDDAELAVQEAEAQVRAKQAALESAEARLTAAETNARQPVYLEAAEAKAESALARVETELSNLPFEIRTAQARVRLATQSLERKISAGGAVPGKEIQQARSELDGSTAELEQLQARRPRLEDQADALKRQHEALKLQLTLKTAETRELAEAQAEVKAAEAHLQQTQVGLAAARLRFDRMTVRAPVAGRVLDMVANAGTRVAGMAGSRSAQEASTVVTLYDPNMLQVRADVRLEDLPQVRPGQPVRIETAAIEGPLDGEVLFATSTADIQKNTLEVKVAVKDPPSLLKPEMLVQATFLAPQADGDGTAAGERLCLFVPGQLVAQAENGAFVWLADRAGGVARRQPVKTGGARGDLVEIVEGLTPASRLIVAGREALRQGQRIKVSGEDTTFGITE